MHWDLSLLELLLGDYDDPMVIEFLHYGLPMSQNLFPITNGSSQVNHKGAQDFPEAINQYWEIEQANKLTVLGPFSHNPFLDRAASSPLNSVPKWDSDKCRVILDMSFPMGTSVNDGIDKDKYLGVAIELAYLTIDAFASMVKMVGPGALMYKWDLCRAYKQIWMDPFDVPYQGFMGRGVLFQHSFGHGLYI